MNPSSRPMRAPAALLAALLALAAHASAATPASAARVVGDRACATLVEHVDAVPTAIPMFLRSYDDPKTDGPLAEPAIATAAYTYDNALAVVALLACERPAQARRIGEALLAAARTSPRLLNVYRSGAQHERPLPNGWWGAVESHWVEDPAQMGTATGNVAWATLALLALADATGEPRWLDGAETLARWIVDHARDASASGYTGGVFGFDAAPERATWKSTEHNVDVAAALDWLDRRRPGRGWAPAAANARAFVAAQFARDEGRFAVGTLPDGRTPNRSTSGLDAQLWPTLLRDPPAEWRRAIDYAKRAHGVGGGFDFDTDRDGIWLEGTAQAALALRLSGRAAEADACLAIVADQFAPSGFVFATNRGDVTTGLAIGPASAGADFVYHRWPHLGATAWAALAARGRNPFVPAR